MKTPVHIIRVEFASKTFAEWSEDAEGRFVSEKVCGAFGPDAADYGPTTIDHFYIGNTAGELRNVKRQSQNPGGQVAHHYPYTVSYRPYEGVCPAKGIPPVSGDRGCNCWPCVLEWLPGKLAPQPENSRLQDMNRVDVLLNESGVGNVHIGGEFLQAVPGGQHTFAAGWQPDKNRDLIDAVLARGGWERVRDWTEHGDTLVTYSRRMYGTAMERPVHLNSY